MITAKRVLLVGFISFMGMGKSPPPVTPYTGSIFTTSTGAILTHVQSDVYGSGWLDSSGNVWHPATGSYSNKGPIDDGDANDVIDSPAIEACKSVGGVLPSVQNYVELEQMFGYQVYSAVPASYISDMEKIFPVMATGPLWTLTLAADDSNAFAYNLVKTQPNTDDQQFEAHSLSEKHPLLCISHDQASFTTSSGAKFTLVVHPGFPIAWRAPGGSVWSSDLASTLSYSDAFAACQKLAAAIPSPIDFENLASDFDRDENLKFTTQGTSDYLALSGQSSNDSYYPYYNNELWTFGGDLFNPVTGQIETYVYNVQQALTRCISE